MLGPEGPHVTVEGFRIQLFTQGIKFAKGGSNIVIRNNDVRNLRANNWYAIQSNASDALVESNRVADCATKWNRNRNR